MISQCLTEIYNATAPDIERILGENFAEYKEKYENYLAEKYTSMLNNLLKPENAVQNAQIIQVIIKKEKLYWGDFGQTQLFAMLEEDSAFKKLEELSYIAFSAAKKKMFSGIFMSEQAYAQMTADIERCYTDVKRFNVDAAKEFRSEAILDLEYAFGETTVMSLRLARLK